MPTRATHSSTDAGADLDTTQEARRVTLDEQSPGPGQTLPAAPAAPNSAAVFEWFAGTGSDATADADANVNTTALRGSGPAPINGLDSTAISDGGLANPHLGHDPGAPLHADDVRRIHRFAVLRVLGSGGMGVVYAGYDEELDRRVAIKVVRDDMTASSHGRTRILREAQAMAKLSHPNVVQVYEVGEFAGQVFVAMEFVKGKTLAEWLEAEERPWEEVLEMYLQAGRGLAAAHREGLVHRDFKPDNVLVGSDGRARVLDFGLARAEGRVTAEDDSAVVRVSNPGAAIRTNLTLAGTIMGTPAFMSPEQHLGQPTDARSDQFSFCVALYGALYGRPPFAGDSLVELTISVTSGVLAPPPGDTRVPAWVFAALKTGLATAPADRHPSMDTLLAALTPDQVLATRRRWLWPAALVGVSTLAVLITLGVVGKRDPTGEDLETIARLTREAHDAAERLQWVYPTPFDPRDTAYNRVVLLEHMDGPAAEPAFEAAHGLRAEFSEALLVLGDRYFDDPVSRPYARDYYVQALVFMPNDERATERAGATLGELTDLQQRASQGQFAEAEMIAAEPLRILADPDRVRAHERALALALDPERSSALGRDRLQEMFRKSGLLAPDELAASRELTDAGPRPTTVAVATPPSQPAAAEPPGAADEELPARLERERRLRPKPAVTGAEATPSPPPEPEPEVQSDPDGSRALSDQAEAARRRGQTSEAEQLFNQALDLWNGNAAALIGLSDLAFERGNFDRAVKYAEKGVRADPSKPDYLIRLGDAYFKVFRYSDAQLRYTRAAELGHPKAAERLTRVREKLGG